MKPVKYISFKTGIIEDKKPNEEEVVTKEILENLHYVKLKMKCLSQNVELPLQYHYTIPLHIIKDKKDSNDKEWLETKYEPEDERIVFIKGE